MCDFTQLEYRCSHLRYIVRAWCVTYQETHARCPLNVVAMYMLKEIVCYGRSDPCSREYRLAEDCGDCRK
ncbi:hypothetical protein C7974DRAFT_391710 [Boeremia exigua]|uniref:uncharacterized protein n=1 Tax=Boeremia exigua TaxID=749465 RepID=UPI001E8CB112|nr:uncharacterized protein C7974DRAFT_391710 [Boeremia exigua]KAH6638509.1 hypothetical protein C7974DRAFT_391710 [Boeremia exigua]